MGRTSTEQAKRCIPSGLLDIGRVCGYRGSVFPKALIYAVPSSLMAVGLRLYVQHFQPSTENLLIGNQMWASFNFVLGMLLIFRTNQAYSRYWEGATLLQQVRGEWFSATSSLLAFCSHDPAKQAEVDNFQHLITRLMSMLYCAGLQQVAMVSDDKLEIIENDGIDFESRAFLSECEDRTEIVLQWIQRLIVDNHESGVVEIPAPILSRVFQELSRGTVNIHNVRKIAEIPFPFPYTQMITVLLMLEVIVTPVLAGMTTGSPMIAGLLTFVTILSFWSINFIAAEIEQPFGEDFNDLPIPAMLKDMNRSLMTLLNKRAQRPPKFDYVPDAMKTCRHMTCHDACFTKTKRRVSGFAKFRSITSMNVQPFESVEAGDASLLPPVRARPSALGEPRGSQATWQRSDQGRAGSLQHVEVATGAQAVSPSAARRPVIKLEDASDEGQGNASDGDRELEAEHHAAQKDPIQRHAARRNPATRSLRHSPSSKSGGGTAFRAT